MIADGQLTLTSAALVAAFNYLGYLLGAYDAMRARRGLEKRLWLGVWGAVALTLLSALLHQPWTHAALRFLIGWSSGWAMVLVAAWTNDQLLRLRRPALSAAVFAGPGTGIFVSGTLVHPAQSASVPALSLSLKKLVWSYSLAGFGYILPATFLSQMAAQRFPASAFGQWVWPVFGAASVGGIVLGILTRHRQPDCRRVTDRRRFSQRCTVDAGM